MLSECHCLRDGWLYHGGKLLTLGWRELIAIAYDQRRSLTAQAHYATPELNFDSRSEQGHPFAYHVYGAAIVEVSLDCLRGVYRVESVQVVHDAGPGNFAFLSIGILVDANRAICLNA